MHQTKRTADNRAPERAALNSAKPSRLSIRDARATIVHRELLERPDEYLTVEDVHKLPRLAGWDLLILRVAVADLVCMGLVTDDELGRLIVLHTEASA